MSCANSIGVSAPRLECGWLAGRLQGRLPLRDHLHPDPAVKLNPRKLLLLRRTTALFASFTFSLSFLRNESRDALHLPVDPPAAYER